MPVTDEELEVAKKLHYAGFLLLPWLWIVSSIYYWSASKDDPRLAYYVKRNIIFASLYTLVLVIWIIVFQVNWRSWGDVGKNLLVVGLSDYDDW